MKLIKTEQEWNSHVFALSGNPLQLWGWGEVKAAHGWSAHRYISDDASWGAQILVKVLPWPFRSFAYCPRGPIGDWDEQKLAEISKVVNDDFKSVVLSIEPEQRGDLALKQWHRSHNTLLVPRTIVLDLTQPDDVLLADMTKKTRQYIRKSQKSIHVKTVSSTEDLKECYAIYRETASRAGFALHNIEYYLDIVKRLGSASPVYAAYEGEQMVAFLWLASSETTAIELYGGVTERGQELKANYGLKWQAITDQKANGLTQYDLNGLLNDGISTFKQGFASHETQLVGTYDKPLTSAYFLWKYGLPWLKKASRIVRR